IEPEILAPTREAMDITSYEAIEAYCGGREIAVVIHAAAVTNRHAEDADEGYIRTNIVGTANVALWCRRHGARLVYISSDYVYPGERGDYTEESPLFPVNRYALSKLGGECSARLVPGSLVIRTSFYRQMNFAEGCEDQITSRMPVNEAARAILGLARRADVQGIVNVGRARGRSVLEIVRGEFNAGAKSVRRRDLALSYLLPPDATMNTARYTNLMTEPATASKTQSRCRFCGADSLLRYLDLGSTPLANSYLTPDALGASEFREELALQVCTACGLSQLTRVVHPDLMFKNYLYVSSTTATFRTHCEELAATSSRVAGAAAGDLVMDIASNDGCLLSKFMDIGMRVVGVDPAENLAAEANAAGIRTLNAYWSPAIARDVAARFGRPKIVTATNVFAHVDDVHSFVDGVAACLAPEGVFVIECPYALDFIEKNEFDTAYHEHLSYIGITPLAKLMAKHGMELFDVEYFGDLHGGTIRSFICRAGERTRTGRVEEHLAREKSFGITRAETYRAFAERVLLNKRQLRELVARERAAGKVIWAYGASAKGNTLVNFFELSDRDVPVVIDDNPKKWGYFTPGARMRIAGIGELAGARVDYLLLLAWNFKSEIIARCNAAHYAGAYIVPVPSPAIIPSTMPGAPVR
ncbi:MAG TPA: sugar nucleotide-binding protein, partial [Bacteroidota bacterium]|nr:sugar nucleotide-binding protein [Bacteroidota bacterium]